MIWRSALLPVTGTLANLGTVLGSIVSDRPDVCGLVVACSEGAVVPLEIEDAGGKVWSGRELAQCGISIFTAPQERHG